METEKRYSFLIFIFIVRSFIEFFRVLTFLISRTAVVVDSLFSVVTFFYTCIIVIVFVNVVLRASILLEDYQRMCQWISELPRNMYCPNQDMEATQHLMEVLDDKDSLTLTGWGFFALKRNFSLQPQQH
ncbi:uncharacterized protein CEXT_436501 [Caerostris extrusa]|uniref:Ion transport domain-containing protein n=1 Tax=Caerostris extrusa TaxID=172846 RepID=A0AAV4M942_CAEEX|nr:uncharacterized protein CEXT_436501 [Caerostris extrusa]